MKSKEFFELFVADLTELEMADLLEASNQICHRNKWTAMRDEVMSDKDHTDLEYKLSEKDDEIFDLENKIEMMQDGINEAIKALGEEKIDSVKKILTEI